mgnify:CR=1 FL=1
MDAVTKNAVPKNGDTKNGEEPRQCRIDWSNKYPDGVGARCNILGGRRCKQKI